jgi:alpha-mannosidase
VLLLYGHGDGGGGPTDDMVQRLALLQDVDGVSRVIFAGPDEYFQAAAARVEAVGSAKLPVWRGELYLELHRGTLTSQQQLKKLNRRCEHALHDAEAACALAVAFGASARNAWALEPAWKSVLLNQFHDVLPGSCTSEVVGDATSSYATALSTAAAVMLEALSSVSPPVSWDKANLCLSDPTLAAATFGSEFGAQPDSSLSAVIAFNPLCVERREVICVPSYYCSPSLSQSLGSTAQLQWAMCKFSPLSLSPVTISSPAAPVNVRQTATGFILQHSSLKVHVSTAGVITSCLVWDASLRLWRESVKDGGCAGKLQLFKDVPLFWDAWDVEFYYESEPLQDIVAMDGSIVDAGPLVCSLRFNARVGSHSHAEIVYSLRADDPFVRLSFNIQWAESHALLRVSFDSSVDADDWLADSQFSVICRSSRRNTSWDRAKFEAAGHKWIAVREHGLMVAVINDCTYGHSCLGGTLSSSLLRSPTHPDPAADRGSHVFNMAFMPCVVPCAIELVTAAARAFNAPVRAFVVPSVTADDAGRLQFLELGFVSSCSHVVVDTVKLPFAWAASKLNFGSSSHRSPCTVASPSDVRDQLQPEFVTPPNSVEHAPRPAAAGLALQTPPSPAASSVACSPRASADAGDNPSRAFETPPTQSLPSPTSHQFQTPPDELSSSSSPLRPSCADPAAAAVPPGTRLLIVRAFEAAGGVAPSVLLRTDRW